MMGMDFLELWLFGVVAFSFGYGAGAADRRSRDQRANNGGKPCRHCLGFGGESKNDGRTWVPCPFCNADGKSS